MELLANIDVDDLERAIAFYRDGIGLTLVRRLFDGSVAEMGGASSPLYLLAKPAGGVRRVRRCRLRDATTAIGRPCTSSSSSTTWTRRSGAAVAAGAVLEGAIRTDVWGRIGVLADPFGHGFCLIQFVGRGYGEVQSGE